MIRINEQVGVMVAAVLLLIAPTRPGAAATEDRSMHQVEQEFGKLNANAPAELSRFSFLIGNWRFEAKVKVADGQWHSFKGTWLGRYILDGYAITDEYRMTDLSGKLMVLGLNLRAYDAGKQTWNIKWLNALTGTWTELAPSELGGVRLYGQSISYAFKEMARSMPRTHIRVPLTRVFPTRTSLGEVRSQMTGMLGANSWSLTATAAGNRSIHQPNR